MPCAMPWFTADGPRAMGLRPGECGCRKPRHGKGRVPCREKHLLDAGGDLTRDGPLPLALRQKLVSDAGLGGSETSGLETAAEANEPRGPVLGSSGPVWRPVGPCGAAAGNAPGLQVLPGRYLRQCTAHPSSAQHVGWKVGSFLHRSRLRLFGSFCCLLYNQPVPRGKHPAASDGFAVSRLPSQPISSHAWCNRVSSGAHQESDQKHTDPLCGPHRNSQKPPAASDTT